MKFFNGMGLTILFAQLLNQGFKFVFRVKTCVIILFGVVSFTLAVTYLTQTSFFI